LRLPAMTPLLTNKFNLPLEQKFEVYELSIQEVLLHSEEDAFLEIPI
jgi:hypothetical protein